ncbi:isoleucine--tRNA ligase [Patescibacteria group bacterium]|nr:isoleucine--tRNA ligase [Patescibacteria group bacterium]
MKKTFPQIEEEIMKFWQEDKTFEKSVEQRNASDSYVFYDGPPFATGLPHYGHIVASTMKDIVPRFWTMRGKRVERRWGWDCHGLPIENIVEKKLNLNGRKDIEKLGVDKFNEACCSNVLLYADEWKKFIQRFGRWVDMENDYKTMDPEFMESVWWVFKSLFEKDLIYEGYKSMHICPRCETTLSNIEISQGYKDVKDISVTVKFELSDEPGTFILAWTTTPWTLPGNVALAVGENIEYVKVKVENEFYILAKELMEKVLQGKDYEIADEFQGKKLENKFYKPLFDFFVDADLKNKENLYKVVTADFVSTGDGTGVVHLAPAFGEDDMNLGIEKNLSFIQHVDPSGRFTKEVTPWAGEEVKPKDDPTRTDVNVLKALAEKGLLFSKEKYEHSYPHCWRCDSPLLNYATSSWFVRVASIKDDLLKEAKNIHWVPGHLKEGRFGKWLEGAKDWAISRSRYWGNPMPIWKSEEGDVICIGSKKELEELSGATVNDLHKQFVDKIEIQKDGKVYRRIPEVLDCWFESGSMPYGQMHYPFENKEKFEKNFPAEFIAEGVDQTRAWFYVLHVLSTSLFEKNAFKNVIVNGIVLAEDGKKMSKRLQNYADPMEVINKYGADALRYYLTLSPVMKAEDLCFSEKGVDEVYKKVVLILLNVLSFYELFAVGADIERERVQSKNILDQWILSKLNLLVNEVTAQMESYDLSKAAKPIGDFVNELSTWYIRRSRDRFKSENADDKNEALQTLQTVLEKLSLVMAPFLPYLSEHIWMSLGKKSSVHLELWPDVESDLIDVELLQQMESARQIVEMGLALRDEAGIKVRQPLWVLEYNGVELPRALEIMIAEELNVKEVILEKNLLSDEGWPDGWLHRTGNNITVALNTEIDEELKVEGALRELVRQINNQRKNQGLTIHDRVKLVYNTSGESLTKLFANEKLTEKLKQSVLADEIISGEGENVMKVNGEEIAMTLLRINES